MHGLLSGLGIAMLLIAGCSSPAPSASAPTSPPVVVPTATAAGGAASPVAKPSPAASPAVGASPSPGPVVGAPILFSGSPTPGFTLISSAFTAGGNLPTQYSCDGPNGGQSPPLSWTGAPPATKAFALVEQDPDIPPPNAVTHWLTYNFPSTVSQLEAGQPTVETLPNGGMQGLNSRRALGYLASCPPNGAAPHHYTLQLYALDTPLPLQPGATILDVQRALTGHIVGQTELIVLFGR